MCKVYNEKHYCTPKGAVYIGRPSKWGNPFIIGRHGNRKEVISKYKSMIYSKPRFLIKIQKELKGKNLTCWCAPLPCHGDILLEIANME